MKHGSPNTPDDWADARAILAAHRAPAPDPVLLTRTRARACEAVEERARHGRRIAWRLTTAGLASLPFALAVDYAVWTLLRAAAGAFLPPLVVTFLSVNFVAWAALGLSVAYGSLPFLGTWAARMKGVADDVP